MSGCLIARAVIVPEFDDVVLVDRFCSDPYIGQLGYHTLRGRKHKNVCKPTNDYDDPIRIVIKNL